MTEEVKIKEPGMPIWARITYSMILSLAFMTFGVLQFIFWLGKFDSVATILDWPLFANTGLLGWGEELVTGIALFIIGLIILWAPIQYFRKKIPEGNSFLLVSSGVGTIFGAIYVLIVVADVIAVLVDAAAEAAVPDFAGFSSLYYPILLGLVALPLFLIAFFQFRKARKGKAV
jgi:hypothetical protein